MSVTRLRIKRDPPINSLFLMKVLKHFIGESIVFSTDGAGLSFYMQKVHLDPYLTPYTIINEIHFNPLE